MTFGLKVYYLLQASYWVQQFILLAARVEKPRKDFKELVAHVSSSLREQADRVG
jgi:acyl-CoA-dependent ceramide synthase